MKNNFLLMIKGGLIGIANIIPGVSGGTMAVVLGIYEQLIDAISNFATDRSKRKEYILFLAMIGGGAAGAVVALSFLMKFLLANYPEFTYLFFIGLIIGSVPSIYRTHSDMRATPSGIASFLAGAGLILFLTLYFGDVEKPSAAATVGAIDSAAFIMLVISGVLAGGSMIVPGISGSFLLVLLGQYQLVISAVADHRLDVLAIVAAGAVAGILSFARLIQYLLRRFPSQTIYFILGLVIASLYPIFPGLPKSAVHFTAGTLLVLCGIGLSFFLFVNSPEQG